MNIKNNKYGYKVCYREFAKYKLKIHLICNDYDLAIWNIRYYETHPQHERKTNNLIRQPTWFVIPVKTYFEYRKLWKDCPF